MPNPVCIRAVARIDFDEWLPLWEGYNAFYGRTGPGFLVYRKSL